MIRAERQPYLIHPMFSPFVAPSAYFLSKFPPRFRQNPPLYAIFEISMRATETASIPKRHLELAW